jgi:hypothetical protein
MILILYFCFFIFVLFSSGIQTCSIYKKETKIELDKNGYKNILIAIDDDVKENLRLIENIKNTFTSASHFLFSVTKLFLFFKQFIIFN